MGFDRLAFDLDYSAVPGVAQPPPANASVCNPHGIIRKLARCGLVGGDVGRGGPLFRGTWTCAKEDETCRFAGVMTGSHEKGVKWS